jgi:hypothetical protein
MNREKRTEQKSIRAALSEQEWQKLDAICAEMGLDRANTLRQLIRQFKLEVK